MQPTQSDSWLWLPCVPAPCLPWGGRATLPVPLGAGACPRPLLLAAVPLSCRVMARLPGAGGTLRHAARLQTAESAPYSSSSQGVASHCWLPFHLPCATCSSARRPLACSGWIPKTWAPVSCQLLGLGKRVTRALGHCGLHAQDLAAAAAAGYRNVVGLPGGVDWPPTLPSLVT